ncbi:hypothetical protein AC1031_006393 [Aphanomyces cochlioides]|nr:hypothetical protein AC1031_006393 [Aphanomyces cochlioides]
MIQSDGFWIKSHQRFHSTRSNTSKANQYRWVNLTSLPLCFSYAYFVLWIKNTVPIRLHGAKDLARRSLSFKEYLIRMDVTVILVSCDFTIKLLVTVKFIALTQEPKEELEAYEVHGQKASNYKPLREFRFAIGIEGGRLTKEYQLTHNVKTVPHVYLVGRDDTIFWHGHPVGLFEDATRRTLAFDFSKPTRSKRDKIE